MRGLRWLWLWGLLALAGNAGCAITVYQPMSGFHRPAVIDPRLPNLADTHLDLHCVPGEVLNAERSGHLCEKVRTLFENQGAQVRTHLSVGTEAQLDEPALDPHRTQLTVELRSRRLHEANPPATWLLCYLSLTILPGISESTFVQEVIVRDSEGFLLVRDALEGRIVSRFGAGPVVGNAIADLFRPKSEKIGGKAAHQDLSADLYQQLSQLVFNGRVQAQLLGQAAAPVEGASEAPALGSGGDEKSLDLPGLN